MKKIIKLPIIVSLLLVMLLSLCAFDSQQQKVYDFADLLSQEEEKTLLDKILEYDNQYELDIVIVTTSSVDGKTTQDYAEEFYANGGFGYDSKRSGSLFLLDMENRKIHVTTEGSAIEEINDAEVEKILDDISLYLPSGEYFQACKAYLDSLVDCYTSSALDNVSREEYLNNYSNATSQSADWLTPVFGYASTTSPARHLRNPLVALAFSVAVGFVIVIIISIRRKSRMTASGATYMDRDSFVLRDSSDIFTGRTTVTRHIDSGNGGSHGGSSHIGGGGMSHGGGGRSF